MAKSKTYDQARAPEGAEPDGHDDGAGGPPRADQGDGVPYWYIDDPQGGEAEPPDDRDVEGEND